MIGSAIGAAAGIGASIFGGISASKAMKKARKMVKAEMTDNENWYDRRYNEDATQRADAQRVLTMTNNSIKERNQQAAAAQAVMGGTEESVAAAKAANSQALAEAASQIAVNGEARKDQIEQTYQNKKASLNQELRNIEVAKANAVTQAASGVAQAASGLGSMF